MTAIFLVKRATVTSFVVCKLSQNPTGRQKIIQNRLCRLQNQNRYKLAWFTMLKWLTNEVYVLWRFWTYDSSRWKNKYYLNDIEQIVIWSIIQDQYDQSLHLSNKVLDNICAYSDESSENYSSNRSLSRHPQHYLFFSAWEVWVWFQRRLKGKCFWNVFK